MSGAWEKALDFTLAYEGGYAFDPADRGGETFRGISRRAWPDWDGWRVVDTVKAAHPQDFKTVLLRDEDLRARAVSFYRARFWDPIHGDELPGKLAAAVFDMAVHSGVKTAVRVLQIALGGLTVDGEIGPKTIKRAYERGEAGLEDFLMERGRFLLEVMFKDEGQRVWARNWFRRLFRMANLVLEGPGVEFAV